MWKPKHYLYINNCYVKTLFVYRNIYLCKFGEAPESKVINPT